MSVAFLLVPFLGAIACRTPAPTPSPDTSPDAGSPDPGPGGGGPGQDTATPGETGAPEETGAPGETGETGGGAPGDTGPAACTTWAEPVAVATVQDTALSELSDLVASRANPGVLWGHEDSGGDPVLYAIDAATGASRGRLTLTGVSNHDWEDLAVAPCPGSDGPCLWVGDTGDNGLSRDDIAIHTVPEPVFSGTLDAAAAPTTYRIAYPDGRNNVEGVAVGADGLPVLVTKRVDATADVFRVPTLDATATVTATWVARIPTGDPADEHAYEATSADLSPDGARLLVRTYGALLEYPVVAGVPGAPASLPSPTEPQGEAASYDLVSGGVWLTSEGTSPTIWFVACAE